MFDTLGKCTKSPDGKHDYQECKRFKRSHHVVVVYKCTHCGDTQET